MRRRTDDHLSVTGEPPRLTMAAARPGRCRPLRCGRPGGEESAHLSVTYEITTRDRSAAKRVHGYTTEDALAPGAIVEIGGRSWLVNRIAGEGVDAWPARYRLTLRHPDGSEEHGAFRRFRADAAPRPPADDARGWGADQLGRRRATARSRRAGCAVSRIGGRTRLCRGGSTPTTNSSTPSSGTQTPTWPRRRSNALGAQGSPQSWSRSNPARQRTGTKRADTSTR